ncbi:hypothetical protein FJY63_10120, partial [Candidatus Sumerlaeota bacterium]|nr:hypothetical protein [Candidatus Sumerlaeota bacterium]
VVKMIDEMQSPFRPDVARHFLSLFAMIGVIVVGLGVVRLRARTRPPMADAIVLLFFGCQAVLHTRHLPLFAIAAAPIMGWIVGQLLQNVGRVYRRRIAVGAMAVTLVVAFNWIAMHGLAGGFWRPATWTLALYDRETYIKRNLRLAGGETYVEVNFPKAVCDFVEANKFNGRMLNPVNVAGYLIWRLSPEKHKLFTDNRFDVFGDRFTWDEWAVRGGIEAGDWDRIAWDRAGLSERDGQKVRRLCDSLGWAEILDRWQINFIVAELSWPVCAKLRASQQWAPVFRWLKPPGVDRMDGYEVFVRRIESNSDLIERCRRAAEAAGEIYRVP